MTASGDFESSLYPKRTNKWRTCVLECVAKKKVSKVKSKGNPRTLLSKKEETKCRVREERNRFPYKCVICLNFVHIAFCKYSKCASALQLLCKMFQKSTQIVKFDKKVWKCHSKVGNIYLQTEFSAPSICLMYRTMKNGMKIGCCICHITRKPIWKMFKIKCDRAMSVECFVCIMCMQSMWNVSAMYILYEIYPTFVQNASKQYSICEISPKSVKML